MPPSGEYPPPAQPPERHDQTMRLKRIVITAHSAGELALLLPDTPHRTSDETKLAESDIFNPMARHYAREKIVRYREDPLQSPMPTSVEANETPIHDKLVKDYPSIREFHKSLGIEEEPPDVQLLRRLIDKLKTNL